MHLARSSTQQYRGQLGATQACGRQPFMINCNHGLVEAAAAYVQMSSVCLYNIYVVWISVATVVWYESTDKVKVLIDIEPTSRYLELEGTCDLEVCFHLGSSLWCFRYF